MPRITDLDKVAPEDIDFRYRDESYLMPGDIDVESTFKIIRLFEAAADSERNGDLDARERANLALRDGLLELFQVRQPELEKLPFGVVSMQHVAAEVLALLGLQVVETPGPPAPRPARQRKGAVPRSRRSSGSRQ